VIDDEGKKQLKRSIKRYGCVGGIVVNKRTGNTIVGGHQKISVLDDIYKYDVNNPETDYSIRCELVDVDEKTEKELNVTLNNPNVGGTWDYDMLREMVGDGDFDYKNAGLTENDLDIIGVDYTMQTEGEAQMQNAFEELTRERDQQHREEMDARREIRDAAKQEEPSEEDKIEHMKAVKQQVKQQAIETAANMDAYVVLSFDTWQNKCAFMERFGYPVEMKMVKGEKFDAICEPILDEE